MTKTGKWIIGCTTILFIIVLGISILFSIFLSSDEGYEDEMLGGSNRNSKIALVEIKEEIIESENIVRQLKKYRLNDDVKAVVLRINSPGGDVASSQEIYDEVTKVRKVKPIVASFGSVAASGGYYIAVGATKIVSNPGSVTGSIGVISQILNAEDLLSKIGIGSTTIKTGKYKDSGSPYRKATEEDIKYFKGTIDEIYLQFVATVSYERKLSMDSVVQLANGQIYTGLYAYNLGLVDTLGTYEDAITYAGILANINGDATIIKERKNQKFMDVIFGEIETKVLDKVINKIRPTIFQYKFQY